MRAKTIATVLAAAAIASLCAAAVALPGGAVAKPGYFKTKGLSTEQFRLQGTNGYEMSVAVVNRRAQVEFFKRVHGGALTVAYFSRARLAPGPDLHFRVGTEGEMNLRFVPHGGPENTTLPGCKGGAEIVEEGALVGTIRFHGREGFTEVHDHRVHVTVDHSTPMICRKPKHSNNVTVVGISGSGGETPEGWVRLIVGSRPGRPQFGADLLEAEEDVIGERELPSFFASISRHEAGAEVSFSAFLEGGPNSFEFPESLEPPATATVEPPAPFSGSATFQLTAPHHASWSGHLTVALPGHGRVRLTGPTVRSGLCRGDTCTPTLPKFLRPNRSLEKDGSLYVNEG